MKRYTQFLFFLIASSVILGAVIVALDLSSVRAQESTSPTMSVAALGTGFTYQGELQNGNEVVNGTCDFQFSLWDAQSGGSQIGTTQTANGVQVAGGRFTTVVNQGNEFGQNAFDGQARWLQLSVRCPSGSGSFTALSPRQSLTAVPYALFALDGNEGPQGPEGPTGPQGAIGPQGPAGEGFRTDCANGDISRWNGNAWVCDLANDHNHGGQSWFGSGMYALQLTNLSTGNLASGLESISSSSSGAGVYGFNSSTTGQAAGVLGITSSITGTGLSGGSSGALSLGVYGSSRSTSGNTIGVAGYVSSPSGWGVYGRNNATTGTGIGVFGSTASPSGWAGWFNGDVNVNGTLVKSAGAFRIDHPLDPENKYLSHSFVESSDMMNVYNGNVALDADGTAWVQLPDWFEALNKDFRYQLTPIGAPAPNLYVAETVANNRFRIAGGESGLEVSWQVTGIRHDPYAEAHPIIVEQEKSAARDGSVSGASASAPANLTEIENQHIRQALEYERQMTEATVQASESAASSESE